MFSAAKKRHKFEKRECCLQDGFIKSAVGIRSTIECIITCMNDDEKCKGVAYDSVMKMCYMSSTLGETCSTSGTTYCGKFITFIIISLNYILSITLSDMIHLLMICEP